MARLLGIDVGTSAVKALVFDAASGQVVAQVSRPLPAHHPQPEWTEFDPQELWETVCQCLTQLWHEVAPESIAALGVASMAEAGVLLDGSGHPVYPIIAWHDPRTEPQAAWLGERIAPFEIYQITGQRLRYIFSLPKILWLREHEPQRFQAGRRWLCVQDYVIWRLAGELATDRTIASRTLAFDQASGTWSPRMLEVTGLDVGLFPPVFPSGTEVGRVTPRAADESGLAVGVPVCTGGHDHLCGAFAVGVVEPGQVLDSSGTAQAILTLTPVWNPSQELFASGFTHYHYVVDGYYIVQGGLSMAGGVLHWLARLLGDERPTPDFERWLVAAEGVPPGANGVLCLPFLLGKPGPRMDPAMRGVFLGLTPATTGEELMRAALEGLAYYVREVAEAFEALLGELADEIIAIGGTTRRGTLPQIKADVTGCRVCVPDIPEATALGAALLAGLGVEVFATPAEAVGAVRVTTTEFEPDPQTRATYERGYALYQEAGRRLAGVHRRAVG